MGLEVSSYITGLNTSWPLAGDTKSQGDDHLRLIKSVLVTTFPNASKSFYLPSAEAFSSTITLDATDQNNLILVDTTAGDVACTLPTLGATDKGWSCDVVRTNTGGGNNGVVVSPASGNIGSTAGNTATIRIECVWEPAKFTWTGSVWFCVKPGIPVGASMNWDGPTVPPGYRKADGSTYSSTTFAELNAALGTTTLRDKRGRVEAGVDEGIGRLTAAFFASAVLGAVGGVQSNATVLRHQHPGTTGNESGEHSHVYERGVFNSSQTGGGVFGCLTGNTSASTGNQSANHNHSYLADWPSGSAAAHSIVQPTIITNKLIRVC